MGARVVWGVVAFAVALRAASADPKPAPVDIKPYRDQLIVLQDAEGGSYVVLPSNDGHVFYGTAKTLYEQLVVSRFANGEKATWTVDVWAPRVVALAPAGSITRREDGTYLRSCGGDQGDLPLTLRTGAAAKQLLDKAQFLSSALVRDARLLARDDAGVYYYVDEIRKIYGGKGYRVFVGKKGAMKELSVTDVATDTAGDVFSTKTGDLRIARDGSKDVAVWSKGDRRVPLTVLDTDANSHLIFRDLGIYGFIGSLCEDL